jgi:uncharacterized protein YuzE
MIELEKRFNYTDHANKMLVERDITREWVERTILSPDAVEADPKHLDRTRAYKTLPERDGRVLRVVICSLRSGIPRNHALPRPEPQTMKTHYDAEADALYLRFAETPVSESEEVRPGIIFDFDSEGRIVAVEILDATEHLANGADLQKLTAA